MKGGAHCRCSKSMRFTPFDPVAMPSGMHVGWVFSGPLAARLAGTCLL